jgi:hypothetical protein
VKEVNIKSTRSISYSKISANIHDIPGYISAGKYDELIEREFKKISNDVGNKTLLKHVIMAINDDFDLTINRVENKAILYNFLFKVNKNFRDQMERSAYFIIFSNHKNSWKFLFNEEMPSLDIILKMAEDYIIKIEDNATRSVSIKDFLAWKIGQQIEATKMVYAAFTGKVISLNKKYNEIQEVILADCIPYFKENYQHINNIIPFVHKAEKKLIEQYRRAEKDSDYNELERISYSLRKLNLLIDEELSGHPPRVVQYAFLMERYLKEQPTLAKAIIEHNQLAIKYIRKVKYENNYIK